MFEKKEKLYEGKSKIVYASDDPSVNILYYKDDATAFNAKKKGTIHNKGVYNNKIASAIFEMLEAKGVKTHFVKCLSEREMAVKKLEIIPVEVVVRNIVAGSLSKRLGIEEGVELPEPLLEFFYKSDPLDDPMIAEQHILLFKWATADEIAILKREAFRVNQILKQYFKDRGIDLVDYKLEFGRYQGQVLLGDEITPDGCRLWDSQTKEKLDKDRFRRDLGKIEEAYQRVYATVCGGAM